MDAILSFADWTAAMTDLVDREADMEPRCLGALDLMERVLAGRERLDLTRFVPGTASYARHLLHRDPEDRFALLGIVWKPGQGTPVHDHPTWGVYGVLKNRIRFHNYASEDGPLVLTGSTIAYEGSATTVLPPHDIHRMANPDDTEISMTLHCYGQEIREFNIFQPASGATRSGSVTYDSLPC